MVDESRLDNLEYDENGNVGYRLGANLECGPNGLRYTGIVRPRLADSQDDSVTDCTPRTDCDCGPVVRNIDGDIWAPPNPRFDCEVVYDVVNNSNTIVGLGEIWQSQVLSDTVSADNCFGTYVTYDTYWQATITDNPQRTRFELTANNSPNRASNCLLWTTDTGAAGLDVYTVKGGYNRSIYVPAGSNFVFNFFLTARNLNVADIPNDSDIGVFNWRAKIVKYTVSDIQLCEDQILGGNGL